MFENVIVDSSGEKDDASITIKWQWIVKKGQPLPNCKYFYCSIDENELFKKSIFLESEILDYFDQHVVNVKCTDPRTVVEQYWRVHPDDSGCVFCQLNNGGAMKAERLIKLSPKDMSRVYLICVYDDEQFIINVAPVRQYAEIEYEIVTAKSLMFWKKENTLTIRISNDDGRKKVLRSGVGKPYAYSVLPDDCSEYYLPKDTEMSEVKIMYLASLLASDK